MFGLGPMELVIVFLIILLVFGAKRIPEIAQGLGKGIMEFKKAAHEITNEFDVSDTTSTTSSKKSYARNELKSQPPAQKQQPPEPQQEKQAEKTETS